MEMLIKDFYTLKSIDSTENSHVCVVEVNPNHDVFKGHFPGNPIMPGVCTMQIIKELTAKITGKTLQLQKATNVKFMSLINPELSNELRLQLDITEDSEEIKVKNTTYFQEVVALKMSAVYNLK